TAPQAPSASPVSSGPAFAIAGSGIVRDVGSALAVSGALGEGMSDPSIGYLVVYHIEIALLFATLVAIGPLVRDRSPQPAARGRPRVALSTSST
ncbi:PucC family protein, partial [Methylobacterium sp. WL116]|uniref:PucC family protein n=1 Tax=Methylobacterium sp. WL116 TaxID=2603889 RepID=UPI0011D99C03